MAKRKKSPRVIEMDPTTGEPTEIRDDDVKTEIKISGRSRAAKRAARELGGETNGHEREDTEPVQEDKEQQINELMQNPKNLISVRRVQPKRGPQNEQIDIEVMREQSPASLHDIKQMVFEEHGGWKFRVAVLDSQGNTLDAILVENPSTREPIVQPLGIDTGQDPYSVPIEQEPIDQLKTNLKKQVDVMNAQQEVEQLREMLDDMKSRRQSGRPGTGDSEVVRLEAKMARLELEQKTRGETEELKARIKELEQRAVTPARNPNDDRIRELEQRLAQQGQRSEMAALIESSDKRFAQIMSVIQNQQQSVLAQKLDLVLTQRSESKEDNFEGMLDKLAKMKSVLGDGDDRVKKFEDVMFDLAFKQLGGRGSKDDDDPDDDDIGKYAIKEFIPVLKDLVKGRVDKDKQEGKPVTAADIQRMIAEEATKAAKEYEARMRAQGATPMLPGQKKVPRSPMEEGVVTGAPPPPPPYPPVQPTAPPAPAPSTQRGQYDIKDAVNYVLKTLHTELTDPQNPCPLNSVAVGDAEDTWPESLLDSMLQVDSAEGLQELLKPYADPNVWQQITDRVKTDKNAEIWVRRLITTIQGDWSHYRKYGKWPE